MTTVQYRPKTFWYLVSSQLLTERRAFQEVKGTGVLVVVSERAVSTKFDVE
jgi:hypothetical protein